MASLLVKEDGTGEVAGANSYANEADFRLYWTARGFDFSVFTPAAAIDRALILATDYIELRFSRNFRGYRLFRDPMQPLSWPRACVYLYGQLVEGVPDLIERATIEYARKVLELPGGLSPDPTYDATGQIVTSSKTVVGPIEKSVTYESMTGLAVRQYVLVDSWLLPLLAYPSQVIRN
jgi:DnaT-like ssDNA binding protein